MLAVRVRIDHYLKCKTLPTGWQSYLAPEWEILPYCDVSRNIHSDLPAATTDWSYAETETPLSPLHSGDVYLYGNVNSEQWKQYYKDLSLAIACLAFCPGGIEIFGHHIEARFDS